MEVYSLFLEPLTIGTMGTQKPFRFKFEQYVQEAKTKMPSRKAAGKNLLNLYVNQTLFLMWNKNVFPNVSLIKIVFKHR